MNIILFGPPGSGKGTQADLICEKYNLLHISTGDLLRSEIKSKSDFGKGIQEIIDSGNSFPYTSEKLTPACSKILPFFKTLDFPPPPSGLSQDSSMNLPSLSIFSKLLHIFSCSLIKRLFVFSLESKGGLLDISF